MTDEHDSTQLKHALGSDLHSIRYRLRHVPAQAVSFFGLGLAFSAPLAAMHHYEAAARSWILFVQMEPATIPEIIQLSLLLAMQHGFRHYCGSDDVRMAKYGPGQDHRLNQDT